MSIESTIANDDPLARAIARATTAALVVVWLAPVALSWQSLAGWGREALGLAGPLPHLVPVALDLAALVCLGLTLHATLRADSATGPRLLVWVFAGASAVANVRHGATISTDAAIFYAAMPLGATLLADVSLRRVRRDALAHLGAIEPALPRYRAARWLVAPRETWRAWCTAVRDGITSPAEALREARRQHDPDGQVPGGAETAAELAEDAAVLAGVSKTRALRLAFDRIGRVDAPEAAAWLGRRGVTVSGTHAHQVARQVRAERPALAVVADGARP